MRQLKTTSFILAALAGGAYAQNPQLTIFGIDYQSPTVGLVDSFTGTPITEGDLLLPQSLVPVLGPIMQPGITESAGMFAPQGLGLMQHALSVGHPAGVQGRIEVDAISHGLDRRIEFNAAGALTPGRRFGFSVDYWSRGIAGTPIAPAVWTEAACNDQAADAFVDLGLPPLPIPPGTFIGGNSGAIDGNGMMSCTGSVYPGLGLIENPPGTPFGDNLDALDGDVPDQFFARTTRTYFSLDSGFVNPITGVPNSGSAMLHGFRGGDVLMTNPGGTPGIYIPANTLGLDFMGPDTDDLDALAIAENGVPGYQVSVTPFDWQQGGTDMVLFSVRRGSAVIGQPDSIFGAPIEAGDILVPPLGGAGRPGILVPAEALGLMTTRQFAGSPGDDLDALDTLHDGPAGIAFCGMSTATVCPCGNNGAPGRGCGNSVNALGAVLWGNGLPSISNDTLLLSGSGMPNTASTVLLQGTLAMPPAPFGDGLRCVAGALTRVYIRTANAGNIQYGYNVPGQLPISVQGGVAFPGTRYYQIVYRNAAPFCTVSQNNTTNALSVAWVP